MHYISPGQLTTRYGLRKLADEGHTQLRTLNRERSRNDQKRDPTSLTIHYAVSGVHRGGGARIGYLRVRISWVKALKAENSILDGFSLPLFFLHSDVK